MSSDVWTLDVFEGLTSSELHDVVSSMRPQAFRRNAQIFSQGDIINSIYVIESGRVRTFVGTRSGAELTTGIYSCGQVLGVSSALSKRASSFSAQMMQPGVLLMLPQGELRALAKRIPSFGWNITRALAFIAEWALERTVHLAADAVSQRVAWALLSLARMQGGLREDGSAVIEGISQEELARLVNATRPWVTQTLINLERSGLVRCARRKIIVPNIHQLETIIDE